MATAPVTVNANLNFNPASLNAAGKQVQSAFGNINLPTKQVNAFNNSLGRITGQASEFDKSMNAATARVFAFGAAVSVINAISNAFKGLVSTTIEVDKRLTEIGSILQATGSQLNSFKNTIFDVAKNTGQSFNTVADAAAELARQGLSAEQTAKRLNAALILTRVSGLDSASSVEALTAAINGFSSAGLTAEQIVNKLIAVDTAFAVSSKDLAEGFSRAGSTAEDAGVSFDELLGLITSVQQTTARGGAVIGNAFKSIFARLSRGTVVEDLKALGVEINASQTGVQKLQALSNALQSISDPTKANAIKELAGGVYQINVVSAALKDLSSETSIFANASKTAAGASNEAFQKNEDLNKSLSAQINALTQGLSQLGSKIGNITLGPVIENLLTGANKLLDILNKVFDPEEGNKLVQGFFKGIGSFIAGPGLILVSAAFFKVFQLVAKFAKEGISDLFKIGSEQERIKNIEGGIVALLQQDANLRGILLSSSTSQAQKEQAVINAIKQQNALLTQQQALVNSIAAAAARAGVGGFTPSGGFTAGKGKKRFAAGFKAEEAEAKSLGATSSVKAKFGKGTIGGQKFIMNNQEVEIPNFAGGRDSAVIPLYANGFVPNFAGGKRNYSKKKADPNAPEFSDRSETDLLKLIDDPRKAKDRARYQKALDYKRKKAKESPERLLIKPSHTKAYPFLIPDGGYIGDLLTKQAGTGEVLGKKYPYELQSRGQIRYRFPNYSPDILEKADDPYDVQLENKITNSIVDAATSYSKILDPPAELSGVKQKIKERLSEQKGAKGAIVSAVGAAFESAITSALGISQDLSDYDADFDVPTSIEAGSKKILSNLFGLNFGWKAAEFKATGSEGNINSYISKVIRVNGLHLSQAEGGSSKTSRRRKAAGFIPNFNSLNKGVPVSQIRAHFDEMGNPLAVTNTRDEPNGLKDAIGRERKGIGAYTENMAANGFVPNYAAPKSIGNTIGLLFGLNTALGALGNSFSSLSEETEKEIKTREDLTQKLEEEKNKEKPNIENIQELEKDISLLNSSIEEAERGAQKINDLFSNLTTTLNLAVTGFEFASMFRRKGKDTDGTVGADVYGKDKQTKSKARKVAVGSLGNFSTGKGKTPIIGQGVGNSIGSSIGKSLAPTLAKSTKGIGPFLGRFLAPVLGQGLKGGISLALRGIGSSLLGGPLGIAAAVAVPVGKFLGEYIGEKTGAAADLKKSEPETKARTASLEAKLNVANIDRQIRALKNSIKSATEEGLKPIKTISRGVASQGINQESFDQNASLGLVNQNKQLKIFLDLKKQSSDLVDSFEQGKGQKSLATQLAKVDKNFVEQNKDLIRRTDSDQRVLNDTFRDEIEVLAKQFIDQGSIMKDQQLGTYYGNVPIEQTANLNKTIKSLKDLANIDAKDPDFATKQKDAIDEFNRRISNLQFSLQKGPPKSEDQKKIDQENIDKLREEQGKFSKDQTDSNNTFIQDQERLNLQRITSEKAVLDNFISNFNATFAQNISGIKNALQRSGERAIGVDVATAKQAAIGQGSAFNVQGGNAREIIKARYDQIESINESFTSANLGLGGNREATFRNDLANQIAKGGPVTAIQSVIDDALKEPTQAQIAGGAEEANKFLDQIINTQGEDQVTKDRAAQLKQSLAEGGATPDEIKSAFAIQGLKDEGLKDQQKKLVEAGDRTFTDGGLEVRDLDAGRQLAEDFLNNVQQQAVQAGDLGLVQKTQNLQFDLQKGGATPDEIKASLGLDLTKTQLSKEQQLALGQTQIEAIGGIKQSDKVLSGEVPEAVKRNQELQDAAQALQSKFEGLSNAISTDFVTNFPTVTQALTTSFKDMSNVVNPMKDELAQLTSSLNAAKAAADKAAAALESIKNKDKKETTTEDPDVNVQPANA